MSTTWTPDPSHVFRETGVFFTVRGWTRPRGDKPDAPGETCDGCHLSKKDFRTTAPCDGGAHPSLPKLKSADDYRRDLLTVEGTGPFASDRRA